MKVKDLIESLKCFNPNANVGVKTIDDEYVDDLYVSYISNVGGEEIDEEHTLQVWIEAVDMCVNCQFFDNNYCTVYDKDASDVEECYQFCEIGK